MDPIFATIKKWVSGPGPEPTELPTSEYNPSGHPVRVLTDLAKSNNIHQPLNYNFGDVYEGISLDEQRKNWGWNNVDTEYFQHVKTLSQKWPHLGILADFMDVGTTPARLNASENRSGKRRAERQAKTKVALLEFRAGKPVTVQQYEKSQDLREGLETEEDSSVKLRLFVVEDLSLDVIEHLGTHLQIPADVFRAHILDFAWHNIRDSYRDQPSLSAMVRRQSWFCMRFTRARYFVSSKSRDDSFEEAQRFNVLREPRDDGNLNKTWDKMDSRVTLTRSKATFWTKPAADDKPATAVLLLDPTSAEGFRLWCHYPNWEEQPIFPTSVGDEANGPQPIPDMQMPNASASSSSPSTEPSGVKSSEISLFEEFIRRAQTFQCPGGDAASSAEDLGLQAVSSALVQVVLAEWFAVADLIKARIFQTEWELAYPKRFLAGSPESTMYRLFALRRFIPSYQEMIEETLARLFGAVPGDGGRASCDGCRGRGRGSDAPARKPYVLDHAKLGISDYQLDFELLASRMALFQQHIDRLMAAATAAISSGDNRRGMKQNRNVQLLTYIVTPFVPMSFVAAIFSMQGDVSELRNTMILFAKTAVPCAVAVIAVICLLHSGLAGRMWKHVKGLKNRPSKNTPAALPKPGKTGARTGPGEATGLRMQKSRPGNGGR